MAAASRNKGAEYERRWAACLRRNGFGSAERGRNNGFRSGDRQGADEFDILGTPGLLWDCKAGYPNASPEQEAQWLAKVDAAARERGCIGLLVRNRNGQGDELNWWVFLTARTLNYLLGLGDVSRLGNSFEPVRLRAGAAIALLRSAGYGDPVSPGLPSLVEIVTG